jgi:hypothetical protein
MQKSFETPSPIRLRLELPKGRVRLIAEEIAVTRVELTAIRGDAAAQTLIDHADIAQRSDEVVVLVPEHGFTLFGGLAGGIEAVVTLPAGSSVDVKTGAAAVETSGRLGQVRVRTGSGPVRLGVAGSVQVGTGSGGIHVESSGGDIEIKSGSGAVSVGQGGADAHLTTGSGRIEVETVSGRLKATSGSGDIVVDKVGDSVDAFSASGRLHVRRADRGRVRARTASGAVAVGVAGGAAAWLDVHSISGRVRSELDETAAPAEGDKTVQLNIHTVSGAVDVTRA